MTFYMHQSFARLGLRPVITALLPALLLASMFASLSVPVAMAEDEKIVALSVASTTDEASGKTLQAKVMIDAPPSLVWQTITNYPDIKRILPGYERSTVLKSSGNTKTVDIGMKVAAFLPTYRYQVVMKEDQPNYNLSIRRISGDFKSLHANYKLIPQGNGERTLVIYNLSLDTGINLPGSQSIIKSNTERSIKALKRHILQEARKSLIGQR
jgi:ribosome-associated toxin RatA of RatAB toxin-antitoxin module